MQEATSLLTTILAIISPISAMVVAWLAFGRNKKQDAEADSARSATVLVELGTIKGGVQDIRDEQKAQNKVNIEMFQRLTAVEESAKQAHKRIDRLHDPISHQDGNGA